MKSQRARWPVVGKKIDEIPFDFERRPDVGGSGRNTEHLISWFAKVH